MLGLPFAFASHFAPTYLHDALNIYRQRFNPSRFLQQPYSMACVNVIAAETNAEAEYLATSFYQLALGMIRNKRQPMQPPVPTMEGVWNDAEKAAVQHMLQYTFIGSVETIKTELDLFCRQTSIDELMVTSHVYDLEAKLNGFRLLAPLFRTADYLVQTT
jgi:luciferase family oxidoreductase group 1